MPDASAEGLQLADRVARLQLSLDPRVLWPDIHRESLDAALREITRVTREVLAGGAASLEPASAGEPLRALGVAAFVSGMGPLLSYWIERGTVAAREPERALLAEHRRHAIRRHDMLQHRLAEIADALAAAGIVPIVLKGMDTAQRYFPAGGTRTIGDIDILVRPEEAARACAALARAGYAERRHTVRPSRSEWVPAGAAQPVQSLDLDHADNPWAIDLHTALERTYHRGVHAALGARAFETVPIELAGRRALSLAQPVLTAWLAIHTGYRLDQLQLARLVELLFVMRTDGPAGRLSWSALTALLHETTTTRFAYPALALAEHLAPGTVPPDVIRVGAAASSDPGRRLVAALAASGTYRLPRRSLDDKLMWAGGPVELLAAWSDVVWPADGGGLLATARLQWRRLRALLAGHVRLRASAHR